jgi:MFS superfamily sulfate permease-like transporter
MPMAELRHLPRISESIVNDLFSGFVVFLVAVPLCLGIALASGAPLVSGIIAGIVGGIVVGLFSKSQVGVSGPAAGLTVICVDAIQTLGSFQGLLLATFIAGLFQILFGALRLGSIAEYVPSSVIKGMLGGIGAVIIIKQIPHLLGRYTDPVRDLSFLQIVDGDNSMSAITHALQMYHPTAALIGIISIFILMFWDRPGIRQLRFCKYIPGSLVVVAIGVLIDQLILVFRPELSLLHSAEHRVNLPIFDSWQSARSQIFSPDFTRIGEGVIYKVAFVIALVASIESLLSTEAVDKLDPYHRITPTNRELFAQGIGNTVSGLCGGLPMTSVIVRSSANIYAGAKTKLSGIAHGVMILFASILVPHILNLIPISALSAVLIMVGYKLISPKTIKQMYLSGVDQYLPFIATVLGIIFTDLLTGVGIGLCFGIFFTIRANYREAISLQSRENDHIIRFEKDVMFYHKSSLKEALAAIPDGAILTIDRSQASYIDHDIKDILLEFAQQATYRDIKIINRTAKKADTAKPKAFDRIVNISVNGLAGGGTETRISNSGESSKPEKKEEVAKKEPEAVKVDTQA